MFGRFLLLLCAGRNHHAVDDHPRATLHPTSHRSDPPDEPLMTSVSTIAPVSGSTSGIVHNLHSNSPSLSCHDLANVGTRSPNRSQSRLHRGTQRRQSLATISDIDEATIMGSTFLNSTGPVTIFNSASSNGASSNRPLQGGLGYPIPDGIPNDNNNTLPTGVFHVDSDIGCYQKADFDIYYHQLLGKGRGTPLWRPGPSMALPKGYRRRGIVIGDVGILYRSGDFDFLFNIFLPADHEINEGRVPDGFRPLERSRVDKNGVSRYVSHDPGSCLASSSVRRTSNINSPNFVFETTDREGAILIMPDGALSEDLRNHTLVEKYISTNAKSWYEYVEGDDCGRQIENGDIRIVVGFDKVTSWGIATFASNVAERVRFEFKGVNDRPTSRVYIWDCIGSGSGRVGPQAEEICDLIEPHGSPLRNQCVFVRTLNFTLSGVVHNKLAVHEVRSNDVNISNSPTVEERTSHPGTSKSTKSSTLGKSGVAFHHSHFGRTVSHPSKFLNKCLLEKFPNAEMVITKDLNWLSVVGEDVTIPDAEEPCARVLASHIICENDGVITLKSRTPYLGSNLSRRFGNSNAEILTNMNENEGAIQGARPGTSMDNTKYASGSTGNVALGPVSGLVMDLPAVPVLGQASGSGDIDTSASASASTVELGLLPHPTLVSSCGAASSTSSVLSTPNPVSISTANQTSTNLASTSISTANPTSTSFLSTLPLNSNTSTLTNPIPTSSTPSRPGRTLRPARIPSVTARAGITKPVLVPPTSFSSFGTSGVGVRHPPLPLPVPLVSLVPPLWSGAGLCSGNAGSVGTSTNATTSNPSMSCSGSSYTSLSPTSFETDDVEEQSTFSQRSRADGALHSLQLVAGKRVRHGHCAPEFLEEMATNGANDSFRKFMVEQKFKVMSGQEARLFFRNYISEHRKLVRSTDEVQRVRMPAPIVFAVTVWDGNIKRVDYYMSWRGFKKLSDAKEVERKIQLLDVEFRRLAKTIDQEYDRVVSMRTLKNIFPINPKSDNEFRPPRKIAVSKREKRATDPPNALRTSCTCY